MASFSEQYEELDATEDAIEPDAEIVHCEEANRDENVDHEVLIELIRSFPILWNTKLRGYKETNKKNTAWNQVALHLGCDGKFSEIIFISIDIFILSCSWVFIVIICPFIGLLIP